MLLSQLLWLCAHILCNRPVSACCATPTFPYHRPASYPEEAAAIDDGGGHGGNGGLLLRHPRRLLRRRAAAAARLRGGRPVSFSLPPGRDRPGAE